MSDDYKKDYEEFWKELLENPDGTLDKDKVMRELHDYRFMLHEVPLVYDHVSGGMISKPNTKAFEVKHAHDDRRQEDIEQAVEEQSKDLKEEKDAEIEVLQKEAKRLESVLAGKASQEFLMVDLTKESNKMLALLRRAEDALGPDRTRMDRIDALTHLGKFLTGKPAIKIDYLEICGARLKVDKIVDFKPGDELQIALVNPVTGQEHVIRIDHETLHKSVVKPDPMCRTEVPRDQTGKPQP